MLIDQLVDINTIPPIKGDILSVDTIYYPGV